MKTIYRLKDDRDKLESIQRATLTTEEFGIEFRSRFGRLMAEISASETITAILVTHNLQAIARCAERVIYLERTIKAWGLWSELSAERELSAIQITAGDHRASGNLDGD